MFKIKSLIRNREQSSKSGKPNESAPDNNSWYFHNTSSDTTIIFIHGFLSNSETCWRSKSGKYWPDLVRDDTVFNRASIFLAGYHTSYDSEDYGIQDCAQEVIRALEREYKSGLPSPISSGNILFICHSLGGVVARYVLEAHTNKFATKTVGLLLMASPSIGSEYADNFLLSGLVNFYRNWTGKQLRYMNDTLIDLDRRFKILIDEKRISNLVGAEAVEHHAIFKIPFIPGSNKIVKTESASRYFGNTQVLAGTNHSTIVKPESSRDSNHLFLCDFFTKKFIPSTSCEPAIMFEKQVNRKDHKTKARYINLAGQVLFDIYSPECAPYYFKRSIDEDLSASLPLYSIWVSGASGCGKTSAIRRLIQESESEPLEICLASYQGGLTSDQIIQEIAITASQRYGDITISNRFSVSDLAKLLAQHTTGSSIILYIDEVPISHSDESGFGNLVSVVATLLDSVKHATGNSNIRFVVSSIKSPRVNDSANRSKFAEQMLSINLPLWSNMEIEGLIKFLWGNLAFPDPEIGEIDELVNAARGLPRFVKAYLRNKFIDPTGGALKLLAITGDQITI